MQEIVFSQIHPFVRYVGDRTIDEKRTNRWMVSRDNRLFLCKNGEGHVQVDQKSFKVSERVSWAEAIEDAYRDDVQP